MTESYSTTAEVARRLNVKERTVVRWCAKAQIAATKLGGQWRIPESAIAAKVEAGANDAAVRVVATRSDHERARENRDRQNRRRLKRVA